MVRNHATIRKSKLDGDMAQHKGVQNPIVHFYGGKNCIGFVLYQVDGSPYTMAGDVNDQCTTNNLAEILALE